MDTEGAPVEGTIAYCSREDNDGCPGFSAHLAMLAQRHPTAKVTYVLGNNIAESRNRAVAEMEGGWIWFIDTDMLFDPNTVKRLLAHEVEVAQMFVLKRHPPHQPILWEDHPARPNAPRGFPRLVEVTTVGAGGTLYRRSVFEKVPAPWFEGILGVEDTNFAAKLRAAGVRMFTDLATPALHATPMLVEPVFVDGMWCVQYRAMNGQKLTMPMPDATHVIPGRL